MKWSLHIGLNSVDPNHYDGWSGELNACERDAEDMKLIAQSMGFNSTNTLLSTQATRDAVRREITRAAQQLGGEGDFFFLTYSGHGGQVPDTNNDENDGRDETWVLFDGQLIDDELYAMLQEFKPGVRVFVLSDSCHSGTVTRVMQTMFYPKVVEERVTYRAMPSSVARRTYEKNKEFYNGLIRNLQVGHKQREKPRPLNANVVLISGCQDNQLSADGPFNGLFTGTLLKVWDHGRFKGSYKKLHTDIGRRMPPNQTPKLFLNGPNSIRFASEKVLSVPQDS